MDVGTKSNDIDQKDKQIGSFNGLTVNTTQSLNKPRLPRVSHVAHARLCSVHSSVTSAFT